MRIRESASISTGTSAENLHSLEWGFFCLKKFEDLDGQLGILYKRGLQFEDYKKAKQYLLTNNYYNLINGYSKYFMDLEINKYLPNASFDEITHLHYFDKELKTAFFTAITEAEKHLKSILAYRFSEAYPNCQYAYLNTSNYDTSKILELGWLISKLSSLINQNKKRNNGNSIQHYCRTHNDVPIWVLIDYLDFGQTNSMLKSLPTDLQNKIAKNICSFISEKTVINSPFTPEIMLSFTENIREVRNICAHNNRLLDFKCKADLKHYPDIHLKYDVQPSDNRKDVYSVFIILQCFLSNVQYATLHNTIKKRVKTLDNQLTSISINNILESLGFPNDWHLNVETLRY